jgi:GDP-4-dehydro-6-deoxy-D-mannose reductase
LKILITGASGFAGSHLADYILSRDDPDVSIWGVSETGQRPHYLNPRLQLARVDLRDPSAVHDLLAALHPHRIYHLAAQAFVPQSWADPWETLENNIRAEINLIQSCLKHNLIATRILIVGSNEEYGRIEAEELPVREASPLRPDSPYGVSKLAQDFLGQAYFLSHGLSIVRVRPFNHIGPRQNSRFVAPNFARQIAAIERGESEPVVRVGNLEAQRDFTDVRDTVKAYVAILEKGQPGEVYNVASGIARPVRAILDGLLAHSSAAIRVEIDPARLRPSDTPIQCGDAAKLKAATGWAPAIPFNQTLKDILDYERQQL